jgi:hypothetical protein
MPNPSRLDPWTPSGQGRLALQLAGVVEDVGIDNALPGHERLDPGPDGHGAGVKGRSLS